MGVTPGGACPLLHCHLPNVEPVEDRCVSHLSTVHDGASDEDGRNGIPLAALVVLELGEVGPVHAVGLESLAGHGHCDRLHVPKSTPYRSGVNT